MNRKRYLNPGEMFFGANCQVETLLGSCVAITLWFPNVAKGGMCHFVLAERQRDLLLHSRDLDGRYGREAWLWLRQQSLAHGLAIEEAQIKLFGGSKVLPLAETGLGMDVGQRNIALANCCLREAGLQASPGDVGGSGHRRVRFDLHTGDVWVRRGATLDRSPFQEAS